MRSQCLDRCIAGGSAFQAGREIYSAGTAKRALGGRNQANTEADGRFRAPRYERDRAVGKPFDSSRHEAVGKRKQEGIEPDIIVEEVSPGYSLGGQVMQVAKVIVAE